MQHYLDLEGQAAIELILARAARALARIWDGGCERVGVIARVDSPGGQGDLQVAFLGRVDAVCQLRRAALRARAGYAQRLDDIAAQLEPGHPEHGVQCVLLGFGAPTCVQIEAADLKDSVVAQPLTKAEILAMLDCASTRIGALAALRVLRRHFFREIGEHPPAFDVLERVVETRWNDGTEIAIAAGHARAAAERLLGTAAGHRARIFLNMLAEAAAKRPVARVNAPGGAA